MVYLIYMKNYLKLTVTLFAVMPSFAFAQETLNHYIDNLNRVIINPLLTVLFAAGILIFLYGSLQTIAPEKVLGWMSEMGWSRENGRQHMWYGMIGVFTMFGVFGIMKFIAATLGTVLPK